MRIRAEQLLIAMLARGAPTRGVDVPRARDRAGNGRPRHNAEAAHGVLLVK